MITNEDKKEIISNYYLVNREWCISVIMKGGPKDSGKISRNDAEDVVNTLFLYYLESPSSFKIDYVYNNLLLRRKNWWRDSNRKWKAEKRYKGEFIPAYEEKGARDPADIVEETELMSALEKDIAAIKKSVHREILTARFLEDCTVREIVNEDIAPERTVYKVLARFREQYRIRYGG